MTTTADSFRNLLSVFSHRKTQSDGEQMPIKLPQSFRNRVLLTYDALYEGRLPDMTVPNAFGYAGEYIDDLHKRLQISVGRLSLSEVAVKDRYDDLREFMLRCPPKELFDLLEVSFQVPATFHIMPHKNIFVDILNQIFEVDGLPYRVTPHITREVSPEEQRQRGSGNWMLPGNLTETASNPIVIAVSDELTYKLAIQPALAALDRPNLDGALEEFLAALSAHRRGQYGEAVTGVTRACESTLKLIAKEQKIDINEKQRSIKALADKIHEKLNIDPKFNQGPQLLGSIRNEYAHGQVGNRHEATHAVSEYAITQAAGYITFVTRHA